MSSQTKEELYSHKQSVWWNACERLTKKGSSARSQYRNFLRDFQDFVDSWKLEGKQMARHGQASRSAQYDPGNLLVKKCQGA
jgi:hypothetical protein